ncbi:lipoprotein N-acyltransferase Lnb domain-containing protein [Aureibacter tunicatorum]|uniref:DUF4105 domain-containing protein n=1 Tax=Aureibacter tunicatorum TaxID=866807 RepID=A0AAE3XL29_9BACT|nr:DUF4105 domain-containing protein [Aureibacter tunicatorum]MDR6238847.1 hypothetical protein [Aureibacter tunicatorum]BDD05226.1 hypothetical protein AUTU_27090 [Aureibacter tunicatorum]
MRLNFALLFFIILFSSGNSFGEGSEKKISLLTSDFGPNLYETFGHSALRVLDPQKKVDEVYSFGNFNFLSSNFYINTLKGKLTYNLKAIPFDQYVQEHNKSGQGLTEQILPYKNNQVTEIHQTLEKIASSRNYTLEYDFFESNCSTEIIKILETQNANLSLQAPAQNSQTTYRKTFNEGLNNYPWSGFLINICFGDLADIPISESKQVFFPDRLRKLISFETSNESTYYNPAITRLSANLISQHNKNQNSLLPQLLAIALSIAVLSYLECAKSLDLTLLDSLILILFGGVSLMIIVFWIFTKNHANHINFNLFWALPSHGAMGILLFSKRFKKFLSAYWLITGFTTITFLFIMAFIPQSFPSGLPILLIIPLIRMISIIYRHHSLPIATK